MKPFDIEHNEKITTGFKTPENYFEQFEAKMMAQIPVEKEVKVVSLFQNKQLWISSFAAVVLLAIAIPVYFTLANETKLDSTTIENYLANQKSVVVTINDRGPHTRKREIDMAKRPFLDISHNNGRSPLRVSLEIVE